MYAKCYVCIACAVQDLEVKIIGVYASEDLARKRINSLRNLGILGDCRVEFYNEELWDQLENQD